MTVPDIRIVAMEDGGQPGLPTVLMGPSLGTSVSNLWGPVAARLRGRARVLGWELPGHGGRPAAVGGFTISELAQGIVSALDGIPEPDGGKNVEHSFIYAGCSAGGCVGQQLLLDHPDRVRAAVLVATAQRVGTPEGWRERAELVATAGTPTQVIGSAKRWFAEGFISRDAQAGTGITTALLHDLQEADRHGYAQVCEALARFDVRGRLGSVGVPVTVLGGAQDVSTTPEDLQELAAAIPGARRVEYDGVAHLPPAEVPGEVAGEIAAIIDTVSSSAAEIQEGDLR
ncbi:alpha/beta fold hydrolase [Kocuria coralli]|uniref:Alpha/beta fold hydrolase n=1 Tax=Kocuria coralli TaxID=1461025 RepID=A0A5J5KZU6_9MICC|nr:alpha/beta fold hydrolase [Kocuria coralli]KAA9395214.1 alpha/beta fold hydrolase [Kocuria coralli]